MHLYFCCGIIILFALSVIHLDHLHSLNSLDIILNKYSFSGFYWRNLISVCFNFTFTQRDNFGGCCKTSKNQCLKVVILCLSKEKGPWGNTVLVKMMLNASHEIIPEIQSHKWFKDAWLDSNLALKQRFWLVDFFWLLFSIILCFTE